MSNDVLNCPQKTAIELLERFKEWGIDIPDDMHNAAVAAVQVTLSNYLKVNNNYIEQRIVGIEMLIEKFKPTDQIDAVFEMTSDRAYDYCDELFGGDSQHVRGKYK